MPTPMPKPWIVGLCAQWCHVCRDRAPDFLALAQEHPSATWLWIDVEDHAALVEALDITTFPTVLVGMGDQLVFFGEAPGNAARFTSFLQPFALGRVTQAPQAPDEAAAEVLARLQQMPAPPGQLPG